MSKKNTGNKEASAIKKRKASAAGKSALTAYLNPSSREEGKLLIRGRQKRLKKNIFAVTSVLLMIFVMLIIILSAQAKVVEKVMEKARIDREIRLLKIKNAQTESRIAESIKLDKVRSRAAELGFQDAGPERTVYISLPQKDRVIIAGENKSENSEKELKTDAELYASLEKRLRELKP